jgi:hypothetical protein
MQAIRTKYGGTWFRSRLEARWAAFFDLCRWSWDYEPLDLRGYIPDFVLSFRQPVLVEVKPFLWDGSTDEVAALGAAQTKIQLSGWQNAALIVGARLDQNYLGVLQRAPSEAWTPVGRDALADGCYGNVTHDFREAGNRTQWAPSPSSLTPTNRRCCCGQPAKHHVEGASTWLCDRCVQGVDDEWRSRATRTERPSRRKPGPRTSASSPPSTHPRR